MKKSDITQKENVGAKIALKIFSLAAEKNASSLCKGLMYEPNVPEKLKKNKGER